MKKRVTTIIGARPQFIKASVLSREIQMDDLIEEVLIHTGQHFDKNMSEIFFKELGILKPKYSLDIHSCSHGKMTGRMLEARESVLMKEKSDLVLVYGDTNSTLAGALVGRQLGLKVIHYESGVRNLDPEMFNFYRFFLVLLRISYCVP